MWELTKQQHGVVEHTQLRKLGLGPAAIRHRVASGRLHPVMRGVYAVGRPELTDRGRWMAAVLACGPYALLSHRSAAALLGLRKPAPGKIEVVIPAHLARRRPGVRVYRRTEPRPGGSGRIGPPPRLVVDEIPVTGAVVTLVDLATCEPTGRLEAAVNEADHLDLVNPETLRAAIDQLPRRAGARRLRLLLDATGLALTATELERAFVPLARQTGLPQPETQARLGSHRVDFYWAELGLVVEADSLRYHRTAFKQSADRRRDNARARSGLTTLRFTHWQVRHEADYVRTELSETAARLRANAKA